MCGVVVFFVYVWLDRCVFVDVGCVDLGGFYGVWLIVGLSV